MRSCWVEVQQFSMAVPTAETYGRATFAHCAVVVQGGAVVVTTRRRHPMDEKKDYAKSGTEDWNWLWLTASDFHLCSRFMRPLLSDR